MIMATVFRGPLIPSPDTYDSIPLSHPDSLYWRGTDIDTDITDCETIPNIPRGRHIPAHTTSGSLRRYIDPWDLENYDYLRRNVESSAEQSLTTPSPAGEPISSTFYYIPGGADHGNKMYAGLDEKSFYNAKFYPDNFDTETPYGSYTDMETSSGDRNSSCGSTVSTLHLHTPGFGVASGQRRLVLPKPPPSIEFPGPPSYDYYELPIDNSYCSLNDCYECITSGGGESDVTHQNIPLYDTLKRSKNNSLPPNHFGLSKKGLLQIDYSCNWNNLDRYIAKE